MALHTLQLGPYPPPEGGISRNMLAIREQLLARGHMCSIIATSKSSRVVAEPGVYHPHSAFELIQLLVTIKFDVLHLHIGGDISPRVLALACITAIFGRNKSVLTLHSGGYPLTGAAMNASPRSIRGFIFKRFSRIIAVSGQIADVFRRYGVSSKRLNVILPYALERPDENITIPAELADFCKNHSPLLLSVGGLEKDYDPLFQVDAMKDIHAEFPQAGLMIVGDGSMRGEVECSVAANGDAKNILIAGNIEHVVTLNLINDADILLRTTLFDGDAISIREALFLGTPVIATDNGMRPDGVHLIELGDKAALIRKVKEVAARRKQDKAEYSPENANITAVVDLYEEVAG
ncbi:MAG: glycosyltransferase family 4 protein [Pyrinomonadaceae bacterium]